MRWRQISFVLSVFTAILCVFFLQFVCFIRDYCLQTDGVLVAAGLGYFFFVQSLLSVAVLYLSYRGTHYGTRSFLKWWRVVVGLYGAIVTVVSVLYLALNIGKSSDDFTSTWDGLSQYSRLYFNNKQSDLESAYRLNTSLTSAFGIVVGKPNLSLITRRLYDSCRGVHA